MLVFAGLVAAAAGCAVMAHGLVRRAAPAPVALPMFGSVADIDLRGPVIYGIALGAINALVDRSVPALAFLGLWLLAGGLVALVLMGTG